MPIEFLITFTYSAAILFMMLLVWGISFVTAMRRNRVGSIQTSLLPQSKVSRRESAYRPLDEWREWNKLRRENTDRIESPVVMPMRYQQPLFFGDPLSDTTKKGAVIDTEAKAS